MNLSTIEQGDEFLSGITPGEWKPVGYHITSEDYKDFTACRSHTDAEFICWLKNHASELLAMAREVERSKNVKQEERMRIVGILKGKLRKNDDDSMEFINEIINELI